FEWDDRVDAVIATVQLNDDKHPSFAPRLDGAGCLLQEAGHRRRQGDERGGAKAGTEEIASGEHDKGFLLVRVKYAGMPRRRSAWSGKLHLRRGHDQSDGSAHGVGIHSRLGTERIQKPFLEVGSRRNAREQFHEKGKQIIEVAAASVALGYSDA